ncbi:MAG: tyrosine--tRNA ligase [Spirochaetaceae bacterium]|nr:tyrosine--tRNA ligase [Spirochaetaceae bacterium]
MNQVLSLLHERGFVKQCTDIDLLDKKLSSGQLTFYCGFDPTGPSLHAGHLVPLFAMAHLSKAGHKAIALVGGGTARIGDPSGKIEMRKIISYEEVKSNAGKIKKQIEKFIDFSENKAMLVDNADWLANLNYIDFLREIGSHFSVNRMLSFEAYKHRLEHGLSFIEFNYQLLQSYDYLILRRNYNCELQLGGDDQWGNIVAGADLIRRIDSKEVIGLTFPLVTRSDGKKMGKTEQGALFLDPNVVTPYDFFQYWRNVADADVEKFLYLYTFLPGEEIRELGKLKDQEVNRAKEILAYEITKIIHGEEEAEKAKEAARTAFGGSADGDKSSISSIEISKSEINNGINVVDLFAKTTLCSSKAEARRLITQGGAEVSEEKISDVDAVIGSSFIKDGEIMLKAGKKRYFRIIVK